MKEMTVVSLPFLRQRYVLDLLEVGTPEITVLGSLMLLEIYFIHLA